MEHIFELFASMIIEGTWTFKKVVKKLKKGVARKLKELGREDLATDSDAKKE